MPIVWKDKEGRLFHDACFTQGETRDGYDQVDLNNLEEDETCDNCGGGFFSGPADDDEEMPQAP